MKFLGHMLVADEQGWQSLGPSQPPAVRQYPLHRQLLKLPLIAFIIFGYLCVSLIIAPTKCLCIHPPHAARWFLFHTIPQSESQMPFLKKISTGFSFPFNFTIHNLKVLFPWEGKEKFGLKTTNSPSLDPGDSQGNLRGSFID